MTKVEMTPITKTDSVNLLIQMQDGKVYELTLGFPLG